MSASVSRLASSIAWLASWTLALPASILATAALGGAFSLRLDLLTLLSPFYAGACFAALCLALIAPRRQPALAVTIGAGLMASGLIILPEVARAYVPGQRASPQDISIVQFNVWGQNRDIAATANWILKTDPDVVVLQEVMGGSFDLTLLTALRVRYPSVTTCRQPHICPTLILSKSMPIAAPSVGSDGNADAPGFHSGTAKAPSATWARFLDRSGQPYTVMSVHLDRAYPIGPQQAQFRTLARDLAAFPKNDLIIAGDFNSGSWSFALRRQDKALGLTRRTRALPTWPARVVYPRSSEFPIPLLGLDHVFAGSSWRTVRVQRGPRLGSDHYPVMARLARKT